MNEKLGDEVVQSNLNKLMKPESQQTLMMIESVKKSDRVGEKNIQNVKIENKIVQE